MERFSHLLFCIAMIVGTVSEAQAKAPRIVTDIPVVQSLVWEVTAGVGNPSVLLASGEDPHHFQMRPSQAAMLDAADLVIWIGPELTPWMTRALDSRPDLPALALLGVSGTVSRAFAGSKDHISADHDHQANDPHAWLDPWNAALWLGAISDALAQADPANATLYRANAALGQARIDALGSDITERLAPFANEPIIVSHDAYGHFAARFDLTILGAIREGDATDPGARHLSELRSVIEAHPQICVFPEYGLPASYLETLTEGLPTKLGDPLDPEGRGLMSGRDLYAKLITMLADAVANCLALR